MRALEAPPANPKPWLFAVALNLARDDGRRAVRQNRKLELLKGEQEGAAVPGPDAAVEANEWVAAVRAALARLSDTDREALLLKAEGFSYQEISSALGLAPGAIGHAVVQDDVVGGGVGVAPAHGVEQAAARGVLGRQLAVEQRVQLAVVNVRHCS